MIRIPFDPAASLCAVLRVVRRRAASPEERALVDWWGEQVAELRKQQPSAEPSPAPAPASTEAAA